MMASTKPPLSVWPCGTPYTETTRETYTEAERDTYTEECHKEGEQKQDARGREGERGTCTEERGTECVRETYTEEESDKETTQKQKATQKQKEEDEEA